jgi:GTP-binding protein EngB required for normal cell division
MLYSEITAVCSQIHTEHINTLCGQNVAILRAKPGRTRTLHAFTTPHYTGRMIMHVEQARIWKETLVAYFEPLF